MQAVLGDQRADVRREPVVAELARREVDGDAQRRAAEGVPLPRLPAGLREHEPAERDDQAGVLGDRDELRGLHETALRVSPAHERLEAAQRAVGETTIGWYARLELAAVEAAAERRLGAEPLHRARPHALVEHLVAVAAGGLRAVHGGVGVTQELGLEGALRGRAGDADRRGREHLVAAQRDRRAQHRERPLGDGAGLVGRREALAHEHELVTAEAGDSVAGPDDGGEAPGDADQELVAEGVPEAVVDELEAIEAEAEHREVLAARRRERSRPPSGSRRACGSAVPSARRGTPRGGSRSVRLRSIAPPTTCAVAARKWRSSREAPRAGAAGADHAVDAAAQRDRRGGAADHAEAASHLLGGGSGAGGEVVQRDGLAALEREPHAPEPRLPHR